MTAFLDDILLHPDNKHFLQRFVNLPDKPHAILLDTGTAGADPLLPDKLAAYLLCCQPAQDACGNCISCKGLKLEAHPDLLKISATSGAFIKISQIKEAIAALSYTPSIAPRQVCIIYDTQKLNQESANALLKTLEEPPANTIFILTTSNKERLLPTILSRVMCLKLLPLTKQQLLSTLPTDIPDAQKQTWLNLAQNNLSTLPKLLEFAELKNVAQDFVNTLAYQNLLHGMWHESRKSVRSKEDAEHFLYFLACLLRDIAAIKQNVATVYNLDYQEQLTKLSIKFEIDSLINMLKLILHQESPIALNINVQLLLDNLYIQLFSMHLKEDLFCQSL